MKHSLRESMASLSTILQIRVSEKNETGWLLLFNINERPKYCFTSKEELSEEVSVCPLITKSNYCFQCKSEQNMKSLFNECYQKSPPIPDLTTILTTDLPTDATPQTD